MSDPQFQVYQQVLDSMRQVTQTSLRMQQEALQQWTMMWPGLPSPQAIWLDKVRDFQKQWSNAVSDLAKRHRNAVDRQYQAALEALDEALRVGESGNPEEYRRRTEQFCRKSLECMREACEAQMKEYQDAMNKMGEMVAKVGS